VNVTSQLVTLVDAWTKFTLTFTLPSITGKTLGTNHCLVLRLWLAAGASAGGPTGGLAVGGTGNIDFAQIKLERGSYASPFIQHDAIFRGFYEDYCRRFYQKYSNYLTSINTVNGGAYYITVPYIPKMYRNPTVTLNYVNGQFSSTLTQTAYGSDSAASFYATATATNTANFLHCDITASAEIW